jgi:hypothetical protein
MTKPFNNTCPIAASIYTAQNAVEILVIARLGILTSSTLEGIISVLIERAKLSTTMSRISTTLTYSRGTTRRSRDIAFVAFNAKKTSALVHSSANTIQKLILLVTFAPCVTRTTLLDPNYTATTRQAQVTTSATSASISVPKTNFSHMSRLTISTSIARNVRLISTQIIYAKHIGG